MTLEAINPEASSAATGIVAPPITQKELGDTTASSSSVDQSHVQSDSSTKPMTKAQLEAEACRPSCKESKEHSVEND